jgi:hypothetical protein
LSQGDQATTIINLLGDLQVIMEYAGTVAVAISGAVAAGRQRMDLVGVVALACVVPVGGGTVRDVVLGRPSIWVRVNSACRIESRYRYPASVSAGVSGFGRMTELQEERPEIGFDTIEVELVDHPGGLHDPRIRHAVRGL